MENQFNYEEEIYFSACVVLLSIVLSALIIMFVTIFSVTSAHAETIDTDTYCDAICKAECGTGATPKCTYLYGIRSIPYDTPEQARQYCKNTVFNTLVKYRNDRCKEGEDDLSCLARRYCPLNSDTDNGTCQYWKKNVKYFLGE